MADFALALPYVLRHEGGWSDDPDDPGGATMRGITLETARRHGIQTKMELRQISDEKVAEIYRRGYWRFDGIEDQRVATKIFDMAVNFGVTSAVCMLQTQLNFLGAAVTIDGRYGPITEASVNAVPAEILLPALCKGAALRYQGIADSRPASRKFLRGWLRRAEEVPV